jgi:hypothetical protein
LPNKDFHLARGTKLLGVLTFGAFTKRHISPLP